MSADRVVLGLDPGTARLGFGLVRSTEAGARYVDHGVIEPTAKPAARRLVELHQAIRGLIARYRPSEVAVEQLFFSRNARTAIAVGQARGVALLTAALEGLLIGEYTPQQVKQAVAGYGGAGKEQVQEGVRLMLGLDFTPEPDDAADALALAICHLNWSHRAELIAEVSGRSAP